MQQTLTVVRCSHSKSHFWFLLSKDGIFPVYLEQISSLTYLQISNKYVQITMFFPNVPN